MLNWISQKTHIKKSHIFWLAVGFIVQLLIGIISFDILSIIWGFGSFLTVAAVIDGVGGTKDDEFPWPFWFPLLWFFGALFGIGYLIYLIFKGPCKFIKDTVMNINKKIDK